MIVHVIRVSVPAMSTIGYGYGKTEDGRFVQFAGDHRVMRDLGEYLLEPDSPKTALLEDWQILKEYSER